MEGIPPDSLSSEAIVVRFGEMKDESMAISARQHYSMCPDGEEEYALSVFAADGLSADEIVRRAGLPHNQVCVSTVERLRAAGYRIVPSPGTPEAPMRPNHADLKLPNPPTDDDWAKLRAAFDPPMRRDALEGSAS